MTRVANYGASQLYLARLTTIRERMHDEQIQVSTDMKAEVYSGISADTSRLINLENQRTQASQFKQDNSIADTKVQAASAAVDSVNATITQFKKRLEAFASATTKDQNTVESLQNWAWQSIINMHSYLATNVDGQYLFSGGRSDTDPMTLPADSLSAFQAKFDGYKTTVPTTRAADLAEAHLNKNNTGNLTFVAGTGIVKAANAGALKNVPAKALISVTNTTSNNYDYTVSSHAATNVGGTALGEGTDGGTALVTTSGGTTYANGATGNLSFAFAADGSMTIKPTTLNSLSNLAIGTRFTISGSTGNAWDGSFVVTANSGNTVTIKNDTGTYNTESVSTTGVTMKFDSNADGIPDSVAGVTLGSGNATFSLSGSTMTLSLPAGTALPAGFAVGQPFTVTGTTDHNGTYNIATIASGATGTTITYAVNPDALRLSKFVPQTGRTDVTISYNNGLNSWDTNKYGNLTFSPTGVGGETITASAANAFTTLGVADPAVGTTITLASTTGVNDGVYKVVSNNGTSIVVDTVPVSGEVATNANIDANSWYRGDTLALEQRTDVGQSIDLSVYASDPAFEKAMRAMYVIAQGKYGTAGGLDQNLGRVNQALYLANDALDSPAPGTPPFGTEQAGDISGISAKFGMAAYTIKLTNTKHDQYMGFFDQRILDISHIDKTEAITTLLNDSNALQASYQSLAQIRSLSLLNYLK
ncbi:MAG: hypothetical protein ACM31L_06700 [Actinomycetota bacterium]